MRVLYSIETLELLSRKTQKPKCNRKQSWMMPSYLFTVA